MILLIHKILVQIYCTLKHTLTLHSFSGHPNQMHISLFIDLYVGERIRDLFLKSVNYRRVQGSFLLNARYLSHKKI